MDIRISPLESVPEEISIYGNQTSVDAGWVAVSGGRQLHPEDFRIPRDISQASCWMTLAAVLNIRLHVYEVYLTQSGTAFIDLLVRMGVSIREEVTTLNSIEAIGNLDIRRSKLKALTIPPPLTLSASCDIAMLAILASFSEGKTIIRGLKAPLPDQKHFLSILCQNLRKMNALIEEFEDGFCVFGRQPLRGADLEANGDWRLAMAFSTAALLAQGDSIIRNVNDTTASCAGPFQNMWKANFTPIN